MHVGTVAGTIYRVVLPKNKWSRHVSRSLCAIVILLHAAGQVSAAGPGLTDAEVGFATRVLPVLKAKCFACHGGDPAKIKGGLDLTTRAALLRGGDSGKPGVVAGKAADSPLYRAVLRTDDDFAAMPPKENDRLSDADLKAVREWIDGGAPWPSAARVAEIVRAAKPAGVTVKTSGGLSPDWTNRTYKPEDLWAYQPLVRPAVPASPGRQSGGETRNPIDAFIDARLAALGLTPAPPADRRTLIRRVTFDLIGLPPTPGEIDAFVNDPDEKAYEKVVDRLLASSHYGEQTARHWLDAARYADSAGFANDYERGNAWRYRDYVVRSFNADKPYDRFVREQIAGDEILEERMKDEGGRMNMESDGAAGVHPSAFILHPSELLVAVGFLRMGPWELTGMEVPRVARQRFLDDVTDTVGQVFLGHALQCARCHDHKFDPVPTRDYYRIQAAFATTQIAERPAAFLKGENTAGFEEQ